VTEPIPQIEAPPERTIRKITAKEASHIGMLTETFVERDAAFLFNLAQAIQLMAKRHHTHERNA
jgi:hypothetical protein